jgi:hypothetical protein
MIVDDASIGMVIQVLPDLMGLLSMTCTTRIHMLLSVMMTVSLTIMLVTPMADVVVIVTTTSMVMHGMSAVIVL